jgi:hypothetical protein
LFFFFIIRPFLWQELAHCIHNDIKTLGHILGEIGRQEQRAGMVDKVDGRHQQESMGCLNENIESSVAQASTDMIRV